MGEARRHKEFSQELLLRPAVRGRKPKRRSDFSAVLRQIASESNCTPRAVRKRSRGGGGSVPQHVLSVNPPPPPPPKLNDLSPQNDRPKYHEKVERAIFFFYDRDPRGVHRVVYGVHSLWQHLLLLLLAVALWLVSFFLLLFILLF